MMYFAAAPKKNRASPTIISSKLFKNYAKRKKKLINFSNIMRIYANCGYPCICPYKFIFKTRKIYRSYYSTIFLLFFYFYSSMQIGGSTLTIHAAIILCSSSLAARVVHLKQAKLACWPVAEIKLTKKKQTQISRRKTAKRKQFFLQPPAMLLKFFFSLV